MSYRDLRNLCEILRTVGYPRLVSNENFRNPNFALVADIGLWFVHQYEPKIDFPSAINTEQERVAFICAFAEFMATKIHVNLNTKRLYQADGYAVKEMIKVASVLYTAMKEADKTRDGHGAIGNTEERMTFDIGNKIDEVKEARALASEITQRGVSLYDMLSKETTMREARQAAMSKAFERDEVERLLKAAIKAAGEDFSKTLSMVESVQNNLTSLDAKIESKKQELERSQKRLLTLKKVRPAFMDEYEKIQAELSIVHKAYVDRFRTKAYLQNQIEVMNRIDSARRAEERQHKSIFTAGEDFLYSARGEVAYSGSDETTDEDEPVRLNMVSRDIMNSRASKGSNMGHQANTTTGPRPHITTNSSLRRNGPPGSIGSRSSVSRGGGGRQMYGSMLGGDDSAESESEVLLGDGDNSDLGSDEPDDDEEDLTLQNTRMTKSLRGHDHQLLRQSHTMIMNGTNGMDAILNNGLKDDE